MQKTQKFGIYLNPNEKKVVRITSPYWFPEEPDWMYLTDEVNATLKSIRELIGEKKLLDDAESVQWGQIPLRD